MQFLKNHWISLLSGVVAMAAIAATVLGLTRTGVVQAMERIRSEAGQIDSLAGNPKNQAIIDAEKRRGEQFDKEYNDALAAAEEINKRTPLLDGVFPAPPPDQIRLAFEFQEKYAAAIFELPQLLEASGPPTPTEIAEEAERIAARKRREALENPEAAAIEPLPEAATPVTPGVVRPGVSQAGAAYGHGPRVAYQSTPSPAGVPGTSAAEVEAQAAIRKARSIRMYAEADLERTVFHVSPIVDATRQPTARDMWYAQVGLWIQQDVVNAIKALNDQAIVEKSLDDKDAHVANLPVKRIIQIRVQGYVTSNGDTVPFESLARAGGTGSSGAIDTTGLRPSFTDKKSDPQFDVIRFVVVVAVDQRDLLRLVDNVTRENFYQLVGFRYYAGPEGGQDGNYLYGPDPVVIATLDFEGYLARRAYGNMMPVEVAKELGIEPGNG